MTQVLVAKFLSEAFISDKKLKVPKKGWRTSIEICKGTGIKKETLSNYIMGLTKHSASVGVFLEDNSLWELEKKKPNKNRTRPTQNRWDLGDKEACTYYLVYRLIPKK